VEPAFLSRSFHLLLPRQLYTAMLAQAKTEYPNECCGLLAGVQDAEQQILHARNSYPLVNEAASKTEYYAVDSLRLASKKMRQLGLDIVAVYHSHPTSPPVPSRTDLERSEFYTHVVHFIISLQEPEPVMRGWWLSPQDYEEAVWRIREE
jgi:proteasome lid subunit RPN8/RPN11